MLKFVCLNNVIQHFPIKKGLVTGIILSAASLGGAIFNFFSLKILNPLGKKPVDCIEQKSLTDCYFSQDISKNVPEML